MNLRNKIQEINLKKRSKEWYEKADPLQRKAIDFLVKELNNIGAKKVRKMIEGYIFFEHENFPYYLTFDVGETYYLEVRVVHKNDSKNYLMENKKLSDLLTAKLTTFFHKYQITNLKSSSSKSLKHPPLKLKKWVEQNG